MWRGFDRGGSIVAILKNSTTGLAILCFKNDGLRLPKDCAMSLPRRNHSETTLRGRPRFRLFLVAGTLLICIALAVAAYLKNLSSGSNAGELDVTRSRARQAFDRGDFQSAMQQAETVLEARPDDTQAAILGAKSAMTLRKLPQAVKFLDRVPRSEEAEYVAAQSLAGDLSLQLRCLSQAERHYRRVLQVDANRVETVDRLGFILGLGGRYWEQIPLRLQLIRSGRFSGVHLMSLGLADEAMENPELVEEYHRGDPADPAPYVMLARLAAETQDDARARELLRQAVKLNPEFTAAQLQLGRLLIARGTDGEFRRWHAALPEIANSHPGIWILRGDWAAKRGQTRQAIRGYSEALQRDPNHSHPNYQLGRLLTSLRAPTAAKPFFERSRLLRRFVNIVKVAYVGDDPRQMKEAAQTAEQLGLIWEAYAWAGFLQSHSARSNDAHQWAAETVARLKSQLDSLPPARCRPGANPVTRFPYRQYPLPAVTRPSDARESQPPGGGELPSVRFVDRAAAAGLRFRYFNGSESVERGLKKMYEFAGGGAAILDYDGDGLPDIHLAQGCRWPADSKQTEFIDRLFRNTGDGRFADVTVAAGLRENGFSQGVTVGDFDSDGFPDLFVANIGPNRLYRNNGDGTFTDATDTAGVAGDAWSTSCLLADLNGDGHPDLYEVNYLSDKDVFTRVCGESRGGGICLPQSFHPAQDRLWINLGDGRFRDATAESGIVAADGKGLGIVAADFHGAGRLSLFVGNDTTPNFLFVNQGGKTGQPLFSERGILSGLALNREGRTESCMGVAAGDADGDGRLDLFVTNFYAESNTLYRQPSTGAFEDVTRFSGLDRPSMPMVGFGAQFLDADLDGWPDLLIANGHIDDFRKGGVPYYQMPPQFFANRGKGRFQLVPGKSLGAYFEGQYLGRALARVDWNQDGREDAVVTHLDAPVALLTNETPAAGGFFCLQLRGVVANRDAIGTVVSAEFGGRRIVQQLTAGDGYFSSNERQLVFGLGNARQIERLIVNWPSGRREEFTQVAANSRHVVVEGRGRLLPLPVVFPR
jgi:tetratricopeptide (TPR) repeat protein